LPTSVAGRPGMMPLDTLLFIAHFHPTGSLGKYLPKEKRREKNKPSCLA